MLLLGVTLLAGEPGSRSVRFPVVLGVPRLPDADLLLRRDGTRQTGVVSQASLRLHTAHGDLVFPTAALAALDLTDDRTGLCTVITGTGDRWSGFLAEPSLELTEPGGLRTNLVRPADVLKLVLGTDRDASPPRPADCLVRLRNGDFFFAQALKVRFLGSADGASLDWSGTAVRAAFFPEGGTNAARLVGRDGEMLATRAASDVFRFGLAAGQQLDVLVARIERLERIESGFLPDDLQARIGVATTPGYTPSVENLAADTRVVPQPGMVWVAPGEFVMGSPPEEPDRDLDEGPLTRMILPAGFWIGRLEVTQTEYVALMGGNPSQYQYEGETQHPVERVSWLDAADYCRRLTERERAAGNLPEDYAYRLPTEAEWEYACRAGTTTRFSFGDDPDYTRVRDYAWFSRNGESTTHPVGTRGPNPWGLHDMHGNVLEWCLDAWRGTLPGGTMTNLATPPTGTLRAVRGGSWLYDARYARSANRDNYGAGVRCSDLGFRVVLSRL